MKVFLGSHFQNVRKAYDVEVSDFLVHMDYYHDHA